MATIIGSSRHDENGKYTGGKLGDQLQTIVDDFKGEVSMQYLDDFVKSRKLVILRFKDNMHAHKMAQAMKIACNNANIGYDQYNRLAVMTDGVESTKPTECDCSSLIRACIKFAAELSVKNFTTANEVEVLMATDLFEAPITYKKGVTVKEGDIFVTTTKGHTGACIEGVKRVTSVAEYIYGGVDFAKVFDPVFYASKNADVKNALGTNPTVLFNHFILYGCNEKSRYGRTIATFNVEVYASHSADLVKAFGALDDRNPANPHCNGYPYYRHYCTNGYAEDRRVI